MARLPAAPGGRHSQCGRPVARAPPPECPPGAVRAVGCRRVDGPAARRRCLSRARTAGEAAAR
eukprot:7209183-Prymnesium_polylepis.1